jgi:acyl-CoA synthetase (AMP-forming)/AMP-acid ligase II
VDRRRYRIKSGGENIYPAEIERALLAHPGWPMPRSTTGKIMRHVPEQRLTRHRARLDQV